MMRLFWLALLFCTTTFFYSQEYALSSAVINESNQPVESVACILQKTTDSLWVKTTVSDAEGNFSFTGLTAAKYKLKLQHMSYENEEHIINVNNTDAELPPFVLSSLTQSLGEVVVSAERPVVKADGGKLIYDVPMLVKNKTVSNAFETLRNIPGIMGVGDELQLAGSSGYTILINGQLTSMTYEQLIGLLKSMPASRVANVEIMYSAPPQYNIRGAAINIVLQDQTADLPTVQGEGNLEYKQAHYAAFGVRGNLLYTKPKFNADFLIGGNKSKGWGDSRMFAIHQFNGHRYDITQFNKSNSDRESLNIRLGMGYTFDNKDNLRFIYTGDYGSTDSKPTSHTIFTEDGNPFSDIDSRNFKEGNSYLHNLKAEYKSHKSLNIGIDYTFYNDPATEKYYDYATGNVLQSSFKTETEQRVNKAVVFANHTLSLPKGWNLTYGGNFSTSNNNNKYDYYYRPDNTVVDSVNNTKQKEYSGSLFAGFKKSFNSKLSGQASASINYYNAKIDIMGNEKTLWDDFQPFFNANLTYMHTVKRILQLSFSSDIDYPPYWALSSDRFKINAYSLAEGNPELKFSRKYKTQLVFIANQKYMAGTYYEYNPDHYIQLPYQSQDKLENIFQMVNLDYSKRYGMFFIVPFMVDKVWDTKATISFIRQEQKDNSFYDVPYKRSMNSFVAQMNNTFNLSSKPNIKLDISGFYMNGAIQGIYDIKNMWDITAGAKYTFHDNNAELMFRVEDIFKGRGAITEIDYMSQYSTMKIYPNAPVFRLSFTYRFGNYKKPKEDKVDTSRFGR